MINTPLDNNSPLPKEETHTPKIPSLKDLFGDNEIDNKPRTETSGNKNSIDENQEKPNKDPAKAWNSVRSTPLK